MYTGSCCGARKEKGLIRIILLSAVLVTGVLIAFPFFRGAGVNVPGRYGTIQEAIDAAEDGATIVVKPGIYRENIDFRGKSIVLRSKDPDNPKIVEATVIDGGGNGPVAAFRSGEGREAMLLGFTITGGSGSLESLASFAQENEERQIYFGGGILVSQGSSPVIAKNVIAGNYADYGGAIGVALGSSPVIENNVIRQNRATEYGGGIYAGWKSAPFARANIFAGNSAGLKGGAGYAGADSSLDKNAPDDNVYLDNQPDNIYQCGG